MNKGPHSFELMEPKHPEALVPASQMEPWVWPVALGLVLILLAVWFIFFRKSGAGQDLHALRKQAYQTAASAFESLHPSYARDAAVQCSLILRRFLSIAAADPALFETHEEFVSRQDSLDRLTPEARVACASGFTRLASLKYAADVPQETSQEVIAFSKDLLETLNQGFHP